MHSSLLRTYPGQIIGWRADGRPIRTIAGGAEGDPPADPPAPSDPPPADPPKDPPADPPKDPAQKVEDLPEWAQKQIRDARTEAGNHRAGKNAAEAKQAETLDAIAKALGLKQDEKPDPAKLASELTAAQAAQRGAQVELAVFRTASKHEGDPTALLDSRTFLAKVSDLDPSAKDFTVKVEAAIKEAVSSNPKLKTGRASGASGVDHSGGAGERRTTAPRSLADSVTDHYGT